MKPTVQPGDPQQPPTISWENIYRAIEVYRRHSPSGSLLVFEMFLLVASRGPVSPVEIARILDVPQAVTSNGLAALDDGGRRLDKSAAPHLVTRVGQPNDARYKLAALTPRGTQLISAMRTALGRAR